MAFFDRNVKVDAALEQVWNVLLKTTAAHKTILSKPNSILLTTDSKYGYLYLLRTAPDGTLYLRHAVETFERVKEIFRDTRGQEALKLLLQPTTYEDEHTFFAEQEADERLQTIAKPPVSPPAPVADAEPAMPKLRIFREDRPAPGSTAMPATPKAIPDEIIEGKFKAGTPWNPMTVSGFMFLISTIGVGIGLGINWRRLGKPEWMLWTILLAIALPIVMILIAIVGAGRLAQSPPILGFAFVMSAFGLNLGFLAALIYLQHGAYKKWQEVGHTATLKAYPYNFTRAALICVGITVLVGVGGTAASYNSFTPREHNGTYLHVTYSPSWGEYPASDYGDFCDDYGCELILSDTRFRYTHILFERIPLFERMTVEAYESDAREYVLDRSDTQFESEHTLTIDGHDAIALEVSQF